MFATGHSTAATVNALPCSVRVKARTAQHDQRQVARALCAFSAGIVKSLCSEAISELPSRRQKKCSTYFIGKRIDFLFGTSFIIRRGRFFIRFSQSTRGMGIGVPTTTNKPRAQFNCTGASRLFLHLPTARVFG